MHVLLSDYKHEFLTERKHVLLHSFDTRGDHERKPKVDPWPAGHNHSQPHEDPTSTTPSTLVPMMALGQTTQPREQRHLPRLLGLQLARRPLEEPGRKLENRRHLALGISSESNRALQLRTPDLRRPGDDPLRVAVGQSRSVLLELLPGGLSVSRVDCAVGGRGRRGDGRRARRAAATAVEEFQERRTGELEELVERRVGGELEDGALGFGD